MLLNLLCDLGTVVLLASLILLITWQSAGPRRMPSEGVRRGAKAVSLSQDLLSL